jgi:hypothetical protein
MSACLSAFGISMVIRGGAAVLRASALFSHQTPSPAAIAFPGESARRRNQKTAVLLK